MRIPWPTDGGPILFQHGFEYLQARRDDQLLELGLRINEDIDQRQVVLGGRKVAIRRPRARRAGEEVPLPPARAFANADPLNRRVVDQMLIGVATRQDARSLDPLGADVTTRGTSKRAVSRRFVAQTQAQLDAWRATPLDALDLVGLLIDGVHACCSAGWYEPSRRPRPRTASRASRSRSRNTRSRRTGGHGSWR